MLTDIWDYVRAAGDRRLREQGYLRSGMGILERYRKARAYWNPHLERNARNLLDAAALLDKQRGGTLLVLGAGRLLDIPWETLFPRFERVVLADADSCIVPYVERLISASKVKGIPKAAFEIGDLTESVVDLSAWAEHTIQSSNNAPAAMKALKEGFERAGAGQPAWERNFADVRMVVSTNLLSQLGYFPRLHIQSVFRSRFKVPFDEKTDTAESLECYFDRVRARHIHDIASLKKAVGYVSSDVEVLCYSIEQEKIGGKTPLVPANLSGAEVPKDAGVWLDAKGEAAFCWPVKITDRSHPLHGQKIKDLWPSGTKLEVPRRWAWHIVPQGAEKNYRDRGRIHIVEAWIKGL